MIDTTNTTDLKRIRNSRMFEFTFPQEITEHEAMELQINAGYHPAGYGFYAFKATSTESTWKCGDSCD